MITDEFLLDTQVCNLFQILIKKHRAPIQLQVSFPVKEVNGNKMVDVIAEYEDQEAFNQLLSEAINLHVINSI